MLSSHLSACQSLSHIQLFATPWTVVNQAPLSMEFPRQEYWSGLPFPPPGDLLDPGIESASPELAAASLPLSHLGSPLSISEMSRLTYRVTELPLFTQVKKQPTNQPRGKVLWYMNKNEIQHKNL